MLIDKLEGVVRPTPVKKAFTRIICLDCSGSMENKFENAKQGVLNLLESDGRDDKMIFIRFSTSVEPPVISKLPLERPPYFGKADGTTALNDAIDKGLKYAMQEIRDGRVVWMNVFTDGGENNSMIKDTNIIKQQINELKDQMTLTFVGTDFDVKACTRLYGLEAGNTQTHDNTAEGVREVYAKTRTALSSFLSTKVDKGITTTKSFYSND